MFTCIICSNGPTFASSDALQSHTNAMHPGPKPFKCDVLGCSRGFSTSLGLAAHRKVLHSTNVSQRSTSGGVTPDNANRTKSSPALFYCTVAGCSHSFPTELNRIVHCKTNHFITAPPQSSSSSSVSSPTAVKPPKKKPPIFPCTFTGCSRQFTKEIGRADHYKAVHSAKVLPPKPNQIPSTTMSSVSTGKVPQKSQPTPSKSPALSTVTTTSTTSNIPQEAKPTPCDLAALLTTTAAAFIGKVSPPELQPTPSKLPDLSTTATIATDDNVLQETQHMPSEPLALPTTTATATTGQALQELQPEAALPSIPALSTATASAMPSKISEQSYDKIVIPLPVPISEQVGTVNDLLLATPYTLSANSTSKGDVPEVPQAMPPGPSNLFSTADQTTINGGDNTSPAVCTSPVIALPVTAIQDELPAAISRSPVISTMAEDTPPQASVLQEAVDTSPTAIMNDASQISPHLSSSPDVVEPTTEESAAAELFMREAPINDVLVEIDTFEPMVFGTRLKSSIAAETDSMDEDNSNMSSPSTRELELLQADELVPQQGDYPGKSSDTYWPTLYNEDTSFLEHSVINRSVLSVRNMSPQATVLSEDSIAEEESQSSSSYESRSSTPFFEAEMYVSPFLDGPESDRCLVPEQVAVQHGSGARGSASGYHTTSELGNDELLPNTSVTSSYYCRICRTDPCHSLTATTCGHLFCYECIAQQVVQTSRCPVCSNMILLYCLFKIDLNS